jgi:hypothetical protein
MKNKKASVLPKWPKLFVDKDKGEIRVVGHHISYGRYRLAVCVRWIFLFSATALLVWIFLFNQYGEFQLPEVNSKEANLFTIALLSIILCTITIFNPWFLARYIMPRRTEVIFGDNYIKINGKAIEISYDEDISFFHSGSLAAEEETSEKMAYSRSSGEGGKTSVKQRFQKVTWRYGSSVREMMNVDKVHLAQQFVAVLQNALKTRVEGIDEIDVGI